MITLSLPSSITNIHESRSVTTGHSGESVSWEFFRAQGVLETV